jgi:hypothetical protein
MREQRDVSLHRPQTPDKAVDALADRGGRFAVRATVSKDVPTRALLANVDGPAALVVPVIPLGEIGFDLRLTAEAREFAGGVWARSRGLVSTYENAIASTQDRSARACVSPKAVSGMSVTPVCRPDSDQNVSPCRK